MLVLRLASRTGVSPKVIAEEWDEEDFRDLQLFHALEPDAHVQLDVLVAMLCSVVAMAGGAKGVTAADFLPEWGKHVLNPEKPLSPLEIIKARAAAGLCEYNTASIGDP